MGQRSHHLTWLVKIKKKEEKNITEEKEYKENEKKIVGVAQERCRHCKTRVVSVIWNFSIAFQYSTAAWFFFCWELEFFVFYRLLTTIVIQSFKMFSVSKTISKLVTS